MNEQFWIELGLIAVFVLAFAWHVIRVKRDPKFWEDQADFMDDFLDT